MRFVYLFLLFLSFDLSAQPYFARYYVAPDSASNAISDLFLAEDTLLLRMLEANDDAGILSTRLVNMGIHSEEFTQNVLLPTIEGGPSIIQDEETYLLASEEKQALQHITLNKVDKNFSFIDSVQLKLDDSSYYYTVGKSILYNEKYIITGAIRNTEGYPKISTIIFIVNKDLTLFDTMVLLPVRASIRPRDMAVNPLDGRLYLSLIYDNYNQQDSTFVPAPLYQRVVSIDSVFQLHNFWISTLDILPEGESLPIAFSNTGTMYIYQNYGQDLDAIFAIAPSGQVLWDTPLDSFTMLGPVVIWQSARIYSIIDIFVASNGDILMAGAVTDPQYSIGQSSFIARASPDGTINWIKIYRSNILFFYQNYGYPGSFSSIKELPGGDIIAGGKISNINQTMFPDIPPGSRGWLVHADSNGCISRECGFIQDAVQKNTYLPIVSTSNEWTVIHQEMFLTSRRKYRFEAISGSAFHELVYEDSFTGTHHTGRYYREEEGIVYNSSGGVVYNMHLGAFDSLPPNPEANQGARWVQSVGTAIYNDNIPRKKITWYCDAEVSYDTLTVVEGIGDISRFLQSELMCVTFADGPEDWLQCFSVNGTIIYQLPDAHCGLSLTSQQNGNIPLAAYPNPANERLYIRLPEEEGGTAWQVTIYNAWGVPVHSEYTVPAGDDASITVSALPAGAYWGVVQEKSGRRYSFSFVIH